MGAVERLDTVVVMDNAFLGKGAFALEAQSTGSFGRSGMKIGFKDLTYSVPSSVNKGERADLLKSVSGYLEPGRMTALMGPSGSGKTTLLDVLAGRKTQGKTEGQILFSGQKPTKEFLRRFTGYVEQFDTLLGILTVEEMLMYTAELKRSHHEPLESKREAVAQVLSKLALEGCKDVKIGGALSKGISGGQAKRTNIGIALITNPKVLFLDEPTSGLDSFTSNEVMTVVKSLIKDGTTICATIHSPTAYTFGLFDRVMMLVKGQMLYFGPQGAAAVDFARTTLKATQGLLSDVDISEVIANPAEWLVDVVTLSDREGRAADMAALYAGSALKRENDRTLDTFLQVPDDLSVQEQKELSVKNATVTPWWWGIKTLLKYRTGRNFTDPAWIMPRFADKLLMGFIVATLYLSIGDNFIPQNLVNMSSVLFMWTALSAFTAASYVPAIVLERALFVRERSDGLYRVITYLIAKLLDEIAMAGITTLAVGVLVFFTVKFQGSFALFWLVYYITTCVGIVLAYFIAALSPNMDVANAALPAYVSTLLFFGGQLITFDSMPDYWRWYSYIDFVRYSWGALMVNQFGENDPIFAGGLTSLEFYGFSNVNKWVQIGYLALFFFGFASLAWLTLTFKKHAKR